ncbi:MAG: CHAD domain-containing protein [Thaumarchaeota archaeon]|nr:CHAD domain-containing protein [Nitrososphaerota archaeon]
MKKRRISPIHFARGYEKLAERVNKSVRDFLGHPNEENVHALRAAIRRLEASISILPKDARKEKSLEEYRFRCGRIFKMTSKIRNLDILENKLAKQKGNEGVAGMLKRIGQEREKSVRRSMKAAWKLFEMRIPRVDDKGFGGCGVTLRKVLHDLDMIIGRELPLVASDETKVGKLHSLRKHCKKFRYALELLPQESFKSDATELLQSWQDVLGAIRDSDVMIGYLEGLKHPAVRNPLLAAERVARHRRYLAFVRSYAEASAGIRLSLVALAGLS